MSKNNNKKKHTHIKATNLKKILYILICSRIYQTYTSTRIAMFT